MLSVNLCSGWNVGGAWVTSEHAAKKLVGSSAAVKGPAHVSLELPQAEIVQGFYRDIAVLAQPGGDGAKGNSRGVWDPSRTIDLTRFVDGRGRLTWDCPAGLWTVVRIGYTLHGNMTKFVGSGPGGLEIDTMSAAGVEARVWDTRFLPIRPGRQRGESSRSRSASKSPWKTPGTIGRRRSQCTLVRTRGVHDRLPGSRHRSGARIGSRRAWSVLAGMPRAELRAEAG